MNTQIYWARDDQEEIYSRRPDPGTAEGIWPALRGKWQELSPGLSGASLSPPGLAASFLQADSMQSVIPAGKGRWAAVHVLLKLGLLQCNLGLSSSFVVKKWKQANNQKYDAKHPVMHTGIHPSLFSWAPTMCQAPF